MSSINPSESGERFGALLKTFRKRTHDPVAGGFLTQARLAELADCGITEATLGHWETGRRTIKHQDRVILRALIRVLDEYNGIQSLDEANQLLETGLYSRLTQEEIQDINPDWLIEQPKRLYSTPESPLTIILSLDGIYDWLDSLFRWSEADAHARTSWVGMFIWSLSSLIDKITARRGFDFLVTTILWLFTGWLIAPILQWPLDNPGTRLRASLLFAVCSIIIPFFVSLFSGTDIPADHQEQIRHQKRDLFLLKLTGATVGFNTVAVSLVFIAVGIFYFGKTPTPFVWGFAALAPLFMGFVGARRIPADRHKMYEGKLQLHPGDPLFLVIFLLIGIGVGAFVFFGYDILSNEATGVSVLIGLAAAALWYRQKQSPIPDVLLIFTVGTLTPFLILCLFLFVFPSEKAEWIVSNSNWIEIALAFVYVVSGTTIWATLQLRSKPTITLKGALGLLLILLFLLILSVFNVFWGRIVTLLVLSLWVTGGRKQFREHLWVHGSVGFLIIAISLSFFLVVQGVPVWANLVGYTLVSIALIIWAYLSN